MNKKPLKEFYLVDYKGKFEIACEELDDFDYEVGKISRKQLIKEAKWRRAHAEHYGVPAFIGEDKELNKLFK